MNNFLKVLLIVVLLINKAWAEDRNSEAETATPDTAQEEVISSGGEEIKDVAVGGRYGLVYSMGKKPEDFDIFVVYKKDKIFSFKKCLAVLGGKKTPVAALRLSLYKETDKKKFNDSLQPLLADFFTKDFCQQVGPAALYGFADAESRYTGSSTFFGVLGSSGVLGAGFWTLSTKFAQTFMQSRQNAATDSLWKFLKARPWGMSYLLVGLGAVAMGGYGMKYYWRTWRPSQLRYEDLAQGSYARFPIDEQYLCNCGSYNIAMPDGEEHIGEPAVEVRTSMSEFIQNFERGLDQALLKKYFVIL